MERSPKHVILRFEVRILVVERNIRGVAAVVKRVMVHVADAAGTKARGNRLSVVV